MNEETNPVEIESEATAETEENLEQDTEAEETKDSGEEAAQEKKDKTQRRIDAVLRERLEARHEAQMAKQEAEQLRQALNDINRNGNAANVGQEDIQELIKLEARKLAAEESFNAACNQTYSKGMKEFPDFDDSVRTLQLVGVTPDFLELVSSSAVGTKIINLLGQDIEEAERVMSLKPVMMAREIAKLEFSLSQKKKTSNAPEPITPISGKSGGYKDPSAMTDAEYRKWRKQR